jgi:hypothetical protein
MENQATNQTNNKDNTQRNNTEEDSTEEYNDSKYDNLLRPEAGVNAWLLNHQTTKPTSTSTGAQAAATLES